MADTERQKNEELQRLISAYGDAEFLCGKYGESETSSMDKGKFYKIRSQAEINLKNYVEKGNE